jgi:hypothetical protein
VSNRIIHQVHRLRDVKSTARAVLLVLADEARDYAGGRSTLTTAQIADRTGLSRRTVHRAYVDLIAAGHITREATAPGAALSTIVHPGGGEAGQPVSAPAAVAEGYANLSAPPCQSVRGSYSIRDIDQVNPSPTPERAREPADQDEVGQVFAAWDAFHVRAGLPPVARGMARRGAVAARIADHGLGNALMIVDRTERAVRERRQPKGQGDLFFSFDMVFGVGKAASIGIFERMLDGEFTPAVAAVVLEPKPAAVRDGEGEAEAGIRAAARAALGDSAYRAWLEPAGVRLAGGEVVISAGSAFAADHIANQIAPVLRRPGLAVRVEIERIHAPA